MERTSVDPPLLSIVIPTRDRIPYAISAIRSILECSDRRLELVVQDNSTNRDLEEWLGRNVNDDRLRYQYSASPLSFVGNFNAAAELATGDYVCFIGDDDGVNPEIMEAADWAKSVDLDALAIGTSAGYRWPDSVAAQSPRSGTTSGELSIQAFSGGIEFLDAEGELRRLVRNGGLYYLRHGLPKLYHGLVHRRCLQAIHRKIGDYFGGLSPDTFASFALACVVHRLAVVDFPLTLPGACPVSGTVMEGERKTHSKRLETAPHLRYRGAYEWCPLVPRVYTVETIWVDSGVAALRAMGREDLVLELNLPRLAAYSIWSNDGVARIVLRDLFRGLRLTGRNRAAGAIRFAWVFAAAALKLPRRIRNRISAILAKKSPVTIEGLKNMVEASHALTRFLAGHGMSFADCVRRWETVHAASFPGPPPERSRTSGRSAPGPA